MFKAARTPTLLKAGTTLSARAVPSAPLFFTCRFKCMIKEVRKTVRFDQSDQIWEKSFGLCYQQRLADSNV